MALSTRSALHLNLHLLFFITTDHTSMQPSCSFKVCPLIMLPLGLHNVLLSKRTCFVQYIKVAPLHNCFSAAVNIMLIFKAFFFLTWGWRHATHIGAEGHVCSRPVTSFGRGGTHLFTLTSALPTWGPGSSAPPRLPRICAPLTGGNTSRVNNVFSQVVPNRRVGDEVVRQTGRGGRPKFTVHTGGSVNLH